MPWISKPAWAHFEAEVAHLREQNAALAKHLRRMDRIEHGLPELEPEKKKPPEPIPDHLIALVRLYDSDHTRAAMLTQMREQHRAGHSWDAIEHEILNTLPVPLVERWREGMK